MTITVNSSRTMLFVAALSAPLVFAGCDRGAAIESIESADGSTISCGGQRSLKGSGSAAQKTAMEQFIAAYMAACPGYDVIYTPNGSGTGASEFLAGQNDFAGSDFPLDPQNGQVYQAGVRCGSNDAWDLPMVFGSIAITYNLPGVDSLILDARTAAMIFKGTITSWDAPQIASLNPGRTLPAQPIVVIYRSDQSGTTENFERYLASASDGEWGMEPGQTFTGMGTKHETGGEAAAAAVKVTPGSIAYNEWSLAKENDLTMARIITSAGPDPVTLTTESLTKAIDGVTIETKGDRLTIDTSSFYRPTQPGAYPIVLSTYEIVCSKYPNPEIASTVKAFLTVALDEGQKNLADSGHPPIPDSLKSKLKTAIAAIS